MCHANATAVRHMLLDLAYVGNKASDLLIVANLGPAPEATSLTSPMFLPTCFSALRIAAAATISSAIPSRASSWATMCWCRRSATRIVRVPGLSMAAALARLSA